MKNLLCLMILTLSAPGLHAQEISTESALQQFERLVSRIPVGCAGARTVDGYDVITISDCQTNEKVPGGYIFSDKPGHPLFENVVSKYPDGSKPTRNIEFTSRDHAFNETNLYLEDLAGGPDSHDVKSVVLLLPRIGIPEVSVNAENEKEVKVILTTGESVIFDKNTHEILSGALKEGPIDLTTDRFKRRPPNVQYTGSGISIRVDHRYEFPTMGAVTAEVRQGTRVCQLPKINIWNAKGELTPQDDRSIVEILNKKCAKKPNEEDFHL